MQSNAPSRRLAARHYAGSKTKTFTRSKSNRPQAERLEVIARRQELIRSLLAVPACSIMLTAILTYPLWR